jgi:YD repeat-containing protein
MYSIPLGKGLTVNVRLDYHSSGIKINDVCDRVGTGWTLNAGGCISREIRGERDELPSGGFYNYSKAHPGHKFKKIVSPVTDKSLFDSIKTHDLDPEPDLFYLSFLDRSYKFFVGNDGNFHTIPYSNIRFKVNPLNLSTGNGEWEIIDESGTHFIFYALESTCDQHSRTYMTAWKLTKIVSAEGATLASFDYTPGDYYSPSIRHMTYGYELFGGQLVSDELKRAYLGQHEYDTSYTYMTEDLNKITIPGFGSIAFVPSTVREDQSRHLIGRIEFDNPTGQMQNKYTLSYNSAIRNYLETIAKTDSVGNSINYRSFTYYPNLPDINSEARDTWGYYNGAINNPSTFPYIPTYPDLTSGNRYPSAQAVAGSIKEIVYPTGGKTLFEFENNKVLSSSTSITVQKVSETLSGSTFGETSGSTFTTVGDKIDYEITAAIQPVSLYSVELSLINVATGASVITVSQTTLTYNGTHTGSNADGTENFKYKLSGDELNAGTYKWIIKIKGDSSRIKAPSPTKIEYSYYKNIASTDTREETVGGIRICNITNYDKDGSVIGKTNYSYLDKEGKCSGIGAPAPCFIRQYAVALSTLNNYLTPFGVEEVSDESISRFTGSPVQYSLVTEERTNGSSASLKTEYKYQLRDYVPAARLSSVGNFYYLPFYQNEYKEGLLSLKTVYKYENGAYTPLEKEHYIYSVVDNSDLVPSFTALGVVKYYQTPVSGDPQDKLYVFGTYDITAAKVYLSAKQVENISGSNSFGKTVNYVYGNNTYLQPTSSSEDESDGSSQNTTYSYCYDTHTAVNDTLTTRNMISMPLITTTVRNSATEVKTVTYGSFNSGSVVEPASVKTQHGSSSVWDELAYLRYDSYGNPLYLKMNTTENTFYLWSYNGRYPIAEIKGGEYTASDVESAVCSVFGVGNIDALSRLTVPDETKLKGGYLQRALPGASVTTYTYLPEGGILTVTNPLCITQRYQYDNFGRLIRNIIRYKDSSGNMTESPSCFYDYHYEN